MNKVALLLSMIAVINCNFAVPNESKQTAPAPSAQSADADDIIATFQPIPAEPVQISIEERFHSLAQQLHAATLRIAVACIENPSSENLAAMRDAQEIAVGMLGHMFGRPQSRMAELLDYACDPNAETIQAAFGKKEEK